MGQAGGRLSVPEGWDELSAAAEGDEDSRTPRAPGFSLLGQLEGGFQVPSGTRDSKNLPRSIVWGRWPMCPGQCVSGWPLLLPADSPTPPPMRRAEPGAGAMLQRWYLLPCAEPP